MGNVEERVDRILNGLNAAEVPARLEQRVMARVAQRSAEAAEASGSRFVGSHALMAKLSPYVVGAAVALLLCAMYVGGVSHRAPGAVEHAWVQTSVTAPRGHRAALPGRAVRSAVVRQTAAGAMTAQAVAADDPDAVALAETLAPSHPAPPMETTPQERAAMRSASMGHAVEMAELHEPGFQTERERATIRQYILGLLDPLVTAQNLTSSPPSADDSQQQTPPLVTDTTTSTN